MTGGNPLPIILRGLPEPQQLPPMVGHDEQGLTTLGVLFGDRLPDQLRHLLAAFFG